MGLEGVFGGLVEGGLDKVGVIVNPLSGVAVRPTKVGVGVGVIVCVIDGRSLWVGVLLPVCGVLVTPGIVMLEVGVGTSV